MFCIGSYMCNDAGLVSSCEDRETEGTKTRIESFMGELPKFAKNLKTFGEADVIKIKSDNWPAVRDRSVTCFMAGYCLQHTGDTYKMYNPWKMCYMIPGTLSG